MRPPFDLASAGPRTHARTTRKAGVPLRRKGLAPAKAQTLPAHARVLFGNACKGSRIVRKSLEGLNGPPVT